MGPVSQYLLCLVFNVGRLRPVEREVPGVVAVLSCQYLEGHKFISYR